MHHELFLALLGHTGDVVERRADGFFVRADAGFLSSAQKSVLNRVLQLGWAYAALTQFVRSSTRAPSIYLRALAQAVEHVLHRYADAVVELEARALRSSSVFPISNMMFEMEEHLEVLPELRRLVRKIQVTADALPQPTQPQQERCLGGARLLDLLYQHTNSGFPRVRRCMQELLHSCHRILFKQILAWMLYGELADPFGEFFIKKNAASTSAALPSSASQRPQTPQSASAAALAWHEQFSMDLEAVPLAYFPTAVAESVFMIGKAVRILTHTQQFTPREAQDVISAISELVQRPVFDVVAVEHAVEKVRRHVAARLHQEVVVKSDFVGYLRVLKGFFLLARGEIFQAFIERSFALMRIKPTHKSEEDVNHGVWRQTVRDLLPEDERWSQDFDMELPLQTFALKSFSSLDGLVLAGLSRTFNNKCLAVTPAPSTSGFMSGSTAPATQDVGQDSGSVWWRHAQLDGMSFSSEFALQLEQEYDNHSTRMARAALILESEDCFEPATLVNGSFELSVPHVSFVSVELAIERLADGSGAQVAALVKPSRGGQGGVRTSPAVDIPLVELSPVLRVRVQYARQQVSAPSSKQVMYKKVLAVSVNDMLVLETQFDLQQALQLHASSGEYWVGIALSPLVRLADWSLDKFSARTGWREGQSEGGGSSLTEQNVAVPPRELWSALRLRCAVRWPLQLLVTPELLRSYAHLFQFCFRLKRTAHALELAWKSGVLRAKDTDAATHLAACELRSRMSFVVRSLELHFQVFVIEGRFNKCVAQIEAAADFDRAKRLHEAFVAGLVKSCYVHTKTVAAALDELLSCCWRFADVVLETAATHGELQAKHVAALDQDFHRRFEFLYGVLQISEARDLLFLLDSNGFFASERKRRKRQPQP